MAQEIWSNTDFPHQCLIDIARTDAFKNAIEEVVRPGDVVLDVGSGSGILSFLASRKTPSRIVAVELDPLLARCLRTSVERNGLTEVIDVVEGNALDIKKENFPSKVDVVLAEIVDTGLMDEQLVPVLNRLWREGIIDASTRIIPNSYQTRMQLVNVGTEFYGYDITAPQHLWPHYTVEGAGWWQTELRSLSAEIEVVRLDFTKGPSELSVDKILTFRQENAGVANGVKICGTLELSESLTLGATNALNGDKFIPIDFIKSGSEIRLRVKYNHGGGLNSLQIEEL